jgi:5-keto 4-deoxyuronate isomerase
MTDPDEVIHVVVDNNGDVIAPVLAHTGGCRNNRHNPATSLCTNELLWPWTV